ncbi:MAG: ornithine cyclodeaminase family protein, partial [Deltaproteobacteria bacterium]|nr:ornithine cyclodeaminase family protein [Deltaproteobacteria bacterium]
SARYLARPESSVVGVLGCGVQGRTNLEALNVLFPLKRVMAYDVSGEAVRRYADEMGARFHLEVVPVSSPREAVTGCDIIITAGPILKKPHATVQAGWMDEGAFATLVDFDSYFHPAAMKESSKFCTDDIPQLLHYREVGYFRDIPPIHAELGDLVTGKKPGREDPSERTMAVNLGLALDDMAVAPVVYRRALETGMGTWLSL